MSNGGQRHRAPSARRLLRRRIARVVKLLSVQPLSDAAIHEARTGIKQARAALRLLRPAIGRRRHDTADRILRATARPLAGARDARVLLDALDGLVVRGAADLKQRLQRALGRQQRRLHAPDLGAQRRALARLAGRVRQWPRGGGWPRLGAALEHRYHKGREARDAARAQPATARLHAWRRQAKHLWYQLQLLDLDRGDPWRTQARNLDRLADLLGDDHDLALLRARVLRAGTRTAADRAAARALADHIDRRRGRLQAGAFTLGESLYAATPGRWRVRLLAHARDRD